MPNTFDRSRRIRSPRDFTRAFASGSVAADGILVVIAIRSTADAAPRLGVTIPKKAGNAVMRNRWKRLIRESFRLSQDCLPRGVDFVIRPKKGASPNWPAIKKGLPKLTRKATTRLQRK